MHSKGIPPHIITLSFPTYCLKIFLLYHTLVQAHEILPGFLELIYDAVTAIEQPLHANCMQI